MADPLRDRRPLRDLAASQQVIEISEKIGNFGRLAELVEADVSRLEADEVPANWRNSVISGRLAFDESKGVDAAATLDLRLSVTLAAVCQRCLKVFELPVETALRLLLMVSGSALDEHEEFEVWELTESVVSPGEIAEEALIMALPLAAMHTDPQDCIATGAVGEGEKTTTPFASLRAQMDEQN